MFIPVVHIVTTGFKVLNQVRWAECVAGTAVTKVQELFRKEFGLFYRPVIISSDYRIRHLKIALFVYN